MSVQITLSLTPETIAAIRKAGDDDPPLPPAARQSLIDAVSCHGVKHLRPFGKKRKTIDDDAEPEIFERSDESAPEGHMHPKTATKRPMIRAPPSERRQTRSMTEAEKGDWTIYIKELTGNNVHINNVGPNTTIDGVINKFCEQKDVFDRSDLRLVFAGKQLELQRTLSEVSFGRNPLNE